MADNSSMRWRVGRSYGIHVYTDSGDKTADVAVATFHDPEDAFVAVQEHNASLEQRSRSDV